MSLPLVAVCTVRVRTLIHARDLAQWKRFPEYEDYSGKTLADLRAEVATRKALETLMYARRFLDGVDTPATNTAIVDLVGGKVVHVRPPSTVAPGSGK